MKKRFRHRLVYALLREPFRLFLKLKFRYKGVKFKPEKGVKGPYLILSNHALAMDPFLLAISFREPIYFVASDMIFSIRFWSKLITYLVSPIPKTKYRSDMETIRDIIKVVKSGGSIGIFPEGNATFSGETMTIEPAIAKLIKLLKIPVVFYRIEGGYLTKPRWAKGIRKGKSIGYVHACWQPEDYLNLSNEAVYEAVLEHLKVNTFNTQLANPLRYKGRDRAEDLESAYFHCTNCGRFATLRSAGNDVWCDACDLHLRYTEFGFLEPVKPCKHHQTTVEWYHGQSLALKKLLDDDVLDKDTVLFNDLDETVLKVIRTVSKERVGTAKIELFKDRIVLRFTSGETEVWPIQQIKASVQQKNKLILYHTKEEKTYYLLNHRKRNALKYVLAIDYLKESRA